MQNLNITHCMLKRVTSDKAFLRYICEGFKGSFIKQSVNKIKPQTKVTLIKTLRNKCTPENGSSISAKVLWGSFGIGTVCLWKGTQTLQVHCEYKPKKIPSSRLLKQNDAVVEEELRFPWKEFFKMLWPDIWYLVGAVLSAFAVAILNIQIPLLLGDLVNVVSKFTQENAGNFTSEIWKPAVHLVQLYGAQGLLTFLYISLLGTVGERTAARMRSTLFESIINQDIAFFDSHKTGEIVNRLTSDVQDFKSSFKLTISQGLRSFTQTVGCVASLLVVSPKLTGVMMVVVPLVIGVGTLLGSGLRHLSQMAQTQVAKATAVADEAIGNVRTVRAFAMETKETELYNNEVNHSARLNQMLTIGIGAFQGLSNLALNGIVLGTLYIGGSLMSTNEIKAGDLMSFMVATQTIQRSLAQMSLLFGQTVRGLSAGARVFEVVLSNFNIDIQGGHMVALVGLSGGGKSTVAALLERFYDPTEGSISIDGVNIKDLNPSWLRGRAIGYINQEPVLFATSVIENIRYGKPEATDDEVIEAARQANAHDFIMSFPEGYNTVLGERGVTVSGGQKQRIAIARALVKNPAILILDEATSALDAESERVVQEALDKVVKGRTVLVIAHRLSTIRGADVIAVMSDGEIVEKGTHQSLKEKRGLYWDLIKQQEAEHKTEEDAHRMTGFFSRGSG